MTPAELRRRAEDLDRQGEAKLAAGAKDEAAALFTAAESHREVAEAMERLQAPVQRGKKPRVAAAAHRVRVSKGRSGDEPDPLIKAANDAGYTIRSLAEKLREEGFKVSHPLLNQCRNGTARIRATVARRIEALTGFRAIKANWPGGWAREPDEER